MVSMTIGIDRQSESMFRWILHSFDIGSLNQMLQVLAHQRFPLLSHFIAQARQSGATGAPPHPRERAMMDVPDLVDSDYSEDASALAEAREGEHPLLMLNGISEIKDVIASWQITLMLHNAPVYQPVCQAVDKAILDVTRFQSEFQALLESGDQNMTNRDQNMTNRFDALLDLCQNIYSELQDNDVGGIVKQIVDQQQEQQRMGGGENSEATIGDGPASLVDVDSDLEP